MDVEQVTVSVADYDSECTLTLTNSIFLVPVFATQAPRVSAQNAD